MPDFSVLQWSLAILAAASVGFAKAGFAGIGIVPVLIFASLFGARDSTGVTLPMLLIGDVLAAFAYRQHARWRYIWRMMPFACAGVAVAAWAMVYLNDNEFRPVLGWIILILSVLQVLRMLRPGWFTHTPHAWWFTLTTGLLAGVTTMLANAAGPILTLYAMAVSLPKLEFVGTIGWFFFLINLFKLPFSFSLGLIHGQTLLFNLALTPAVAVGLFGGRWLVDRLPQTWFHTILMTFALVAALRLIGAY